MERPLVITVGLLWSASNVLAACYPDSDNPPCKGNFDYDCDVDANDIATFIADIGRSPYHYRCPSNGPRPVPRTGQTTSYATGDDGDHERGVALVTPRFTDNLDGTVTDNQTGLIWLKDANCFGQRTWNNALSDCNGLADGSCGLTDGSQGGDWRLPNIKELQSLMAFDYLDPALPTGHLFTSVQTTIYWSSTTYALNTNAAILVDMRNAHVGADGKYSFPN